MKRLFSLLAAILGLLLAACALILFPWEAGVALGGAIGCSILALIIYMPFRLLYAKTPRPIRYDIACIAFVAAPLALIVGRALTSAVLLTAVGVLALLWSPGRRISR